MTGVQTCALPIWLPLGLALGSPVFPWSCEGKLGVLLESLQGAPPRNFVFYELIALKYIEPCLALGKQSVTVTITVVV